MPRAVRRSTRRLTQWNATENVEFAAFGVTAIGKVLMGRFTTTSEHVTIVRIRGTGFFNFIPGADNQTVLAAVGICLAGEQAGAAGAASLPGPVNDAEDERWLWHRYFISQSASATAPEPQGGPLTTDRYEIDSKAMRKFQVGEEVVAMFEAGTIDGGALDAGLAFRMLFKLP